MKKIEIDEKKQNLMKRLEIDEKLKNVENIGN